MQAAHLSGSCSSEIVFFNYVGEEFFNLKVKLELWVARALGFTGLERGSGWQGTLNVAFLVQVVVYQEKYWAPDLKF